MGLGPLATGSFGDWELWTVCGASIPFRAQENPKCMSKLGGICSSSVRATHASKACIGIHLQQPDAGQTASCIDQAQIGTGLRPASHGKSQTQVEHNAGHDWVLFFYRKRQGNTWLRKPPTSNRFVQPRGRGLMPAATNPPQPPTLMPHVLIPLPRLAAGLMERNHCGALLSLFLGLS